MCPETESNRRHGDFQAPSFGSDSREKVKFSAQGERHMDRPRETLWFPVRDGLEEVTS